MRTRAHNVFCAYGSNLLHVKLWCCLFLIALHHAITDATFFPLVEFGCSRDFVSCASLLTVVSTSLLAVVSTLSSMLNFAAMFSFCFLNGWLV